MGIIQALIDRGHDECIEEEIQLMINRVRAGEDAASILLEYGLDADYEEDLLRLMV